MDQETTKWSSSLRLRSFFKGCADGFHPAPAHVNTAPRTSFSMASDGGSPLYSPSPQSIPLQDLSRPPDDDDRQSPRSGGRTSLRSPRTSVFGRVQGARYELLQEGSPSPPSRSEADNPLSARSRLQISLVCHVSVQPEYLCCVLELDGDMHLQSEAPYLHRLTAAGLRIQGLDGVPREGKSHWYL